jgi:DNA-binding NarL/FixJ family response regulator
VPTSSNPLYCLVDKVLVPFVTELAETKGCSALGKMIAVTDQVLLLECLTPVLKQQGVELVAKGQTSADVIALVKLHNPDVLLCSSRLNGGSGVLLLEQIKTQLPKLKMMLLADPDELPQMVQAVKLGVHGIVTTDSDLTQLTAALDRVLAGSVYISEHISPLLVQAMAHNPLAKDLIKLDLLNMKQKLILQLTAEGYTAKEIANKLYLSSKTVEFHRSTITRKLSFGTHSDWVRFAIRNGLMEA